MFAQNITVEDRKLNVPATTHIGVKNKSIAKKARQKHQQMNAT